jgi:hypothetical protein
MRDDLSSEIEIPATQPILILFYAKSPKENQNESDGRNAR